MAESFFERPILNSPYEVPRWHHALDDEGQPLDLPPIEGRRESKFITPVPKPRKRKKGGGQESFVFGTETGVSDEGQEYNPTPIINEIRQHVASWRKLPNPADWGVTPATARLLTHWRHHNYSGVRPFFCQVEAVETIIWLTEVARGQKRYAKFWEHLKGANEAANPELLRIAMKMATGSGKTTVMAMLIAWQTVNAVRSPTSNLFTRGFLIVTPGITIRDRLRVLLPEDPDNYYRSRELLPADMIGEIGKAKIVITNYHAFKRRETMNVSKVGRALLQGRDDEPPVTVETEGQMLQRACGDLLAMKNVVVINDEAHHCYRHKVGEEDEEELKGEEKDEAKKNEEAARLWINGIEALGRKVGVRAVYDLSATPFFLRGSGYAEGTLFPWTVSDFSLMDAIECGIVKLPRVPVAQNLPGDGMPMYRELWKHIGNRMPKKGRGKSGTLDPMAIPNELQTALYALYSHYAKTFEEWKRVGIATPPVFIVVCNNTSTSQLVYEWISGWDRPNEDGEPVNIHRGHLELFRNYDEHGNRLPKPNTLLIDSEQLESGEALDTEFRHLAAAEIDQFKRELIERTGDAAAGDKITDQDLLREVMNTVGKSGRLGEQIRCVVSVSMLTEGWDTNTVTHILGVRAFGTQLLCEQVVGRGLRRQSYEEQEDGLFEVEYADNPDTQRRFRVIENVEEMEAALAAPWERWTVFLHPVQRAIAEQALSGPARVAGSAGTGKTIVAIHRAARLAEANPNARVLLTTFSEPLANALSGKLRILLGDKASALSRITVAPFQGVAEELYQLAFGRRPGIASAELIRSALQKAAEATGVSEFDIRFLVSEWTNVVDAWQLRDEADYANVSRLGRKNRLGAKQRGRLWPVFAVARQTIRERGARTAAEIFGEVTAHWTARADKPFTNIVVDEAQDLGVAELRMLAAIAPPGLDALFFAGDIGQRIFQQPFSWRSLGIDVRGRSQTLKVNYRTSHQIRNMADHLLPRVVRDVDGLEQDRTGTVSVFNGPTPTIVRASDQAAEAEAVSTFIKAAIADDIAPAEIGVFVRSRGEIPRAREAVRHAGFQPLELSGRVEETGNRISVGTMHLAKGLEFRAVVVMACDDDILPQQTRVETVADEIELDEVYETERHLFYVACTRARDRLFISGASPASEFLDDFEAT